MCAAVQNKFWPMHEALFAAQPQWAPLPNPSAKLESVAASVAGIDMNTWKTCVAKHSTAAAHRRRSRPLARPRRRLDAHVLRERQARHESRRRRRPAPAPTLSARSKPRSKHNADGVRFPVQLGYRALGAARARSGGRRPGQRIQAAADVARATRNSRALSRMGTDRSRSQPTAALDARAVGRRGTSGASGARAGAPATVGRSAGVHALLAERRGFRARSRRRFPRLSPVRYAGRRTRRASRHSLRPLLSSRSSTSGPSSLARPKRSASGSV